MKVVGAFLAVFLLLRAVFNFYTFDFISLVIALVYFILGIFVVVGKKEASIFVVILSAVSILSLIVVPVSCWWCSLFSDGVLFVLAIFNLKN